ncbi:MAG: hypothetical protein JJLCMIEE_02204 [Acidimicrobiales bacterium]|nr:MAG: pyrimidine reductase family protein [Actinomycetota bacterium]MBV6509136.1 hypothetical protein [Acidimicrobiales bacterium]RIK08513.1 MAG: pyrimidine reductase family protein [Acidobacteriota bacterium]
MQQLYPQPVQTVDVEAVYAADQRPAPPDRPWVLANMVSSVDGATALDGVSGPLGGAADRFVFAAIRAVPDAILVAGGTVRSERYGPPRLSEASQRRRSERGQRRLPRLAIVTGSLRLDFDAELFRVAPRQTMIFTAASAPAGLRARAEQVAEVVETGDYTVDIGWALRRLRDAGVTTLLSEGGPSLLGQLVEGDFLDEICLTSAPLLVGGDSKRIVAGARPEPRRLRLDRVLAEDGVLFYRYLRDRRQGNSSAGI